MKMIVKLNDLNKFFEDKGFSERAICTGCGLTDRKICTNSRLQWDSRLNEFVILFVGPTIEFVCYECGQKSSL